MLKDRMLDNNMASVEELKVPAHTNGSRLSAPRWPDASEAEILEAPPPFAQKQEVKGALIGSRSKTSI